MEKLTVTDFRIFRDGGTMMIKTNLGYFCFDYRAGTKTYGCLYSGEHPSHENAHLINDNDLEKKIIEALKEYKKDFYKLSIDYLIKKKENKLIVTNFDKFSDGGTISIKTNLGYFCYDFRIGTKTEGCLYSGEYPSDKDAFLVNDRKFEKELIQALREYKNEFYQTTIDDLINEKQKTI